MELYLHHGNVLLSCFLCVKISSANKYKNVKFYRKTKGIRSMKDKNTIFPCSISISDLPVSLFLADLAIEHTEKEMWKERVAAMLSHIKRICKPEAFLCFPAERVLSQQTFFPKNCALLAVTLGELADISENNFADSYLFHLISTRLLFTITEQSETQLNELCAQNQSKVVRRLEAPSDFDSKLLPSLLAQFQGKSSISLIENQTLNPLNSMLFVYELQETNCENRNNDYSAHHCNTCQRMNCPMRRYHLTILPERKVLFLRPDESISSALISAGIALRNDCGGQGSCGKCHIQVTDGSLPITQADKRAFSILQLASGFRLACQAHLSTDISIKLCSLAETQMQTVSSFHTHASQADALAAQTALEGQYGIAIDIGTTTLAAALVRLSDGVIVQTASSINRQRLYGADVISRIQAATKSRAKAISMQRLIIGDLLTLIKQFLANPIFTAEGEPTSSIVRIVLSGNTTMIHLLMGYDCSGLGVYPFTPHSTSTIQSTFLEIFRDSLLQCPVMILPGISAFVGGDIVSDFLSCEFDQKSDISLLIDLGTNGEMAIGNKDKILVSSTAAGPAFEGGSIQYGTGSIPGAISNISMKENTLLITTIDEKAPCGICGTGVLELTALLLEQHYMDFFGLLKEPWQQTGFPVAKTSYGEEIKFTQQDIRQVQLAKSAIRSGIELLLKESGYRYEDISKVYLAGGFGAYLNIEKAVSIGLLPKELSDKVIAVGNASLHGAVLCCQQPDRLQNLEQLISVCREQNLAELPDFQELFLKHMNF